MEKEKPNQKEKMDVFDLTSGTWNREETPEELVEKSRKIFCRSMQRHQE
ncbi:MAG: hypothetical protein QGG64_20870 [Candidatus Latescibacteria bacterium]|jgi:hypothetical protein|nr:hypothetical protein [Candidatus Latescibacterota bacterium]